MKLAQNKTLVAEIQSVVNGKHLNEIIGGLRTDYLNERNAAMNAGSESVLTPESPEFLHSFARFKGASYDLLTKGREPRYISPVTRSGATAAMNAKPDARNIRKIKSLKEAKAFEEVYNSIFSDRALQIGTDRDPTAIGSYIDYSPYINNYQYYLSIPTLGQTIDRGIQIATRENPEIEFEDRELSELLEKILKRSQFMDRVRKMLLFSHLSPRGSLIAPIQNDDGTIRFNIFNDTQFTYATGYQYSRVDFRDDNSGVQQIFCLGHILQNGVTAHFLCPGFEPIYAIGKNRLYQLKDAAEAVNIYLYTIKVLCIRAQIMVQKWGGEGQNDTLLQRMQKQRDRINSELSLNTAVELPEGADLTILNNNLSEGFSKVSPIIKEYQAMLSGVMPDYFYGSDTAYSANSFNIHATHQTIRSDIQEGQIEPIFRFCINALLRNDVRFKKWEKLADDFDIEFKSLYEPTETERVDIDSKKIDNIIKMAGYPELEQTFKDGGLFPEAQKLPDLPEPENTGTTRPPET